MFTDSTNSNDEILPITPQSSKDDSSLPLVRRELTLPRTPWNHRYPRTPTKVTRCEQAASSRLNASMIATCSPTYRERTLYLQPTPLSVNGGVKLQRVDTGSNHPATRSFCHQVLTRYNGQCLREVRPTFQNKRTGRCLQNSSVPSIGGITNYDKHACRKSNDRTAIQSYMDAASMTCASKNSFPTFTSEVRSSSCEISDLTIAVEDGVVGGNRNTVICVQSPSEPSRNEVETSRRKRLMHHRRKRHHYYSNNYPMKMRQLHRRRHKKRDSNDIADNCFVALVACFCCLPLGIISLYYTWKVKRALSNNKTEKARLYSLQGRKFAHTSVKLGITGISMAILFWILKDKVPYSSLEYDYYLPDYAGA